MDRIPATAQPLLYLLPSPEQQKTNVTYHLTGLKYNTTYHYRVVASNSIGTTYGKDQTFTTPAFFAYLPIVLR